MARRRRQLTQDARSDEPDSVEQEFGAEHSEETLNLLRSIQRPEYLEESSSLDPLSDLDEYVEHGFGLPPATYDALQKAGKDNMEALEELQTYTAPKEDQEAVRYRQQLAQGTSQQDMTWLKLRAYHRAKDQLSAIDQQPKANDAADRLKAHEVPVDKVPADLLNMTPEQLAERQRLALMARAYAARKAREKMNAVQRILSRPEPSEESEWVHQPTGGVLSHAAAAGITAALREHQGSIQLLPPVQEDSSQADSVQPPLPVETEAGAAAPRVAAVRKYQTVYTQAHLEQQRLKNKLHQQQRQRTLAFWLSFATVSGAYVAKMIRRKLLKSSKTTKPQPGAKQPRISETSSVRA